MWHNHKYFFRQYANLFFVMDISISNLTEIQQLLLMLVIEGKKKSYLTLLFSTPLSMEYMQAEILTGPVMLSCKVWSCTKGTKKCITSVIAVEVRAVSMS